MLRLIGSSNPDDVTKHAVRAHYYQRLVLNASVCRELKPAPEDVTAGRVTAALHLLAGWMQDAYELPGGDIKYTHGLTDRRLMDYAADMVHELGLGAQVCDALSRSYTADKSWELEGDIKEIRRRLGMYLAEFGE